MTDKAAAKLRSDGWTMVETSGFLHLVGPLWQRVVDDEHEYALAAQDKHQMRSLRSSAICPGRRLNVTNSVASNKS